MIKIYALLIVVLPLVAFAQVSPDSLRQVWSDARKPDTVRAEALHQLAYRFINSDPDSAMAIAERQLAFAKQEKLPRWEARALNLMGLALRRQSNFDGALQHYEQSIALLEQAGDRNYLAAVYGNMGDVYRLRSNFPKAVECLTKSLALAEETGDRKKMADAFVSIATIFYDDPGNNEKVLEYLEKAKEIYEGLNNNQGLALVYGNLSAVYLNRENYEQALLFTEKTLTLQQKLADEYGAATSYFNRASIYTNLGRVQEALADYDRAVTVFKQMGDIEGVADAYKGMGILWVQQGRYAEAISMCENALRIAREIGSPNLSEAEALECLYLAHQKQGNYRQALGFLEQLDIAKDSLRQQETAERLQQMELERRTVADSLSLAKERFEVEKTLRRKDRNLGLLLAAGLGILVLAWDSGTGCCISSVARTCCKPTPTNWKNSSCSTKSPCCAPR